MKNLFKITFVLFVLYSLASAQQKTVGKIPELSKGTFTNFSDVEQSKINLSGSLKLDYYSLQNSKLKNDSTSPVYKNEEMPGKKSPLLAGAMSLLVPGAGQFYTGGYWKTAAFLAIEGVCIAMAIRYNNKGDNQTNFFQNYADQNWSVVRYAEWIIKNKLDGKDPGNLIISNDPNKPAWDRVNWAVLNKIEFDYNVGSHQLPPYGTQQYYELIGKYHEFASGWDDFLTSRSDPSKLEPTSPHFQWYSGQRGKANDLYAVASTYVKVIVINHFLSAIDAAWSASRFNKRLSVSMKMNQMNIAGQIEMNPELNFNYNF